jgi:hypothetical protein
MDALPFHIRNLLEVNYGSRLGCCERVELQIRENPLWLRHLCRFYRIIICDPDKRRQCEPHINMQGVNSVTRNVMDYMFRAPIFNDYELSDADFSDIVVSRYRALGARV